MKMLCPWVGMVPWLWQKVKNTDPSSAIIRIASGPQQEYSKGFATGRDMRILISILFVIVQMVLIANTTAQTTQTAGSSKLSEPIFSVEIHADKYVVAADSPVIIVATLTNMSDHEITMVQVSGLRAGYDVDVRNSQGKRPRGANELLAEQNKENKEAHRPIRVIINQGGARTVNVKPGQTLRDEIQVSNIFDLTIPGTYTIQLTRKDSESTAIVKSNTITVTVTP